MKRAKGEAREIKCLKCGYIWFSRSKMFWITCPKCQAKTKATNQKLKGGNENGKV